eukprot:TRINITY_DN48576_c0_g1_i1.p2 TRINITY_DN48576_c0_g1~~TRINITY_DN48576_c0_g1_i1.p2  ORF type:complete len:194 (+),score=27.09 TRINITY_DN48576_c0_g1_i1:82-663(+)
MVLAAALQRGGGAQHPRPPLRPLPPQAQPPAAQPPRRTARTPSAHSDAVALCATARELAAYSARVRAALTGGAGGTGRNHGAPPKARALICALQCGNGPLLDPAQLRLLREHCRPHAAGGCSPDTLSAPAAPAPSRSTTGDGAGVPHQRPPHRRARTPPAAGSRHDYCSPLGLQRPTWACDPRTTPHRAQYSL